MAHRLFCIVCACALLGLMPGLAAEEDAFVLDMEAESSGVRLKDLVEIQGVRDNQLHGVGIVVGLEGSGDGSAATLRMLRQMLASKNLNFSENDLASENVAMVAVTADLPAFARSGSRLPTTVSCIGDAESLRGGVLLQTPLVAADGKIYAVGQGSLTLGGFGAAGPDLVATGVDHQNVQTVAELAEGAIVEREVPATLLYGDRLRLVLRQPDFSTAHRVAQALGELFDPRLVEARDAAMITLRFADKPSDDELVGAIARLEKLRVEPDQPARLVINSRTGTVVVGRNVRVSTAAVSHGGLSLKVQSQTVRRPDPQNPAQAVEEDVFVNQVTGQRSDEPPDGVRPTAVPGTLNLVQGATVEEISNALNAMGARPRDLVAIFQALHRAGALHAELVVM